MKLPGTQFQDHTWPPVRKLLGALSVLAAPTLDWKLAAELVHVYGEAKERAKDASGDDALAKALEQVQAAIEEAQPLLDDYRGKLELGFVALGEVMHRKQLDLNQAMGIERDTAKFEKRPKPSPEQLEAMAGAMVLLGELAARPSVFVGFLVAAVAAGPSKSNTIAPANWRKLVNNMFSDLRDIVDSDGYRAVTGRDMSPSRMYCYRHVEMAARRVQHLLRQWDANKEQVGAILGREITARPIESARVRRVDECKGEWILSWSATLAEFSPDGAPGPFDTKSKKLDWVKGNPARIDTVLAEIAAGELQVEDDEREQKRYKKDIKGRIEDDPHAIYLESVLSAMAQDVVDDAPEAGTEPEVEAANDSSKSSDSTDEEANAADDQAATDEAKADEHADAEGGLPEDLEIPYVDPEPVSLPPGKAKDEEADEPPPDPRTEAMHHCLKPYPLPVRLAVYREVLGAEDETYPDEWLDPATGALPTIRQLAIAARMSEPTLRSRRDAARKALTACLKQRLSGTDGCEGENP